MQSPCCQSKFDGIGNFIFGSSSLKVTERRGAKKITCKIV
jgi:hypothetical protein